MLHGLVVGLRVAIVFRHPAADVLEGRALGNGGCDGPPMAVGAVQWWLPGAALLHNQVAATALAGAALPNGCARPLGTLQMRVSRWPTDFFFSAGCGLAYLSRTTRVPGRVRGASKSTGERSTQGASVMMH